MAENNKRSATSAGSRDAMEMVKQKARDLAAGAGDVAGAAKDKMREWTATAADKAGDTVQELGKELTKVVRRYPLQSVLVGVALGFWLARKTRN